MATKKRGAVHRGTRDVVPARSPAATRSLRASGGRPGGGTADDAANAASHASRASRMRVLGNIPEARAAHGEAAFYHRMAADRATAVGDHASAAEHLASAESHRIAVRTVSRDHDPIAPRRVPAPPPAPRAPSPEETANAAHRALPPHVRRAADDLSRMASGPYTSLAEGRASGISGSAAAASSAADEAAAHATRRMGSAHPTSAAASDAREATARAHEAAAVVAAHHGDHARADHHARAATAARGGTPVSHGAPAAPHPAESMGLRHGAPSGFHAGPGKTPDSSNFRSGSTHGLARASAHKGGTDSHRTTGWARGGGDTSLMHNKVVHEGRAGQRVDRHNEGGISGDRIRRDDHGRFARK